MRGSPSPLEYDWRLRRLAAYGLPGAPRAAWSLEADDRDWSMLQEALVAQKLTGLALAADANGQGVLGADRRAQVRALHRGALLHALAVEAALLGLAPEFRDAGVEFLVLKGPAVASAAYAQSSWRTFRDLDLLVPTAVWRQACAVLARLGFRRQLPEPRPGFDERFGKAATHVGPGGLTVDLHHRLVLGPFGLWADAGELFARQERFELGGCSLPRLGDTDLLLHACMHASLGWHPALLVPLRDVVQIATEVEVDWDLLRHTGRRFRLTAVMAHAFAESAVTLGVPLAGPAAAIVAADHPRTERRSLEAYLTGRRRGGIARSTMWAIPGLGPKLSYGLALACPDRTFVRTRGSLEGGSGSYLERWMAPLRWLAPGTDPSDECGPFPPAAEPDRDN